MADPSLDYDPITGFLDADVFVTNPTTQAATRTLFQRLFTQVQTFLNVTFVDWVKATFATKSELTGIALGSIPNDSIGEAQMANEMKKAITGGVESYNTANSHRTDAVAHVTGDERTTWNAKATPSQGSLADAALPAASYTANDVLTKVKSVDGTGSGLDADTLDGVHASALATLESAAMTITVANMTNGQWFGLAYIAPVAADGSVYDLVYPTSTGFNKADADAAATMPCMGMRLEAGTGSRLVLRRGLICNTSWNWTVGGPIWVDVTSGAMTQIMPAVGKQIQAPAYALTANVLDIDPAYIYGERV